MGSASSVNNVAEPSQASLEQLKLKRLHQLGFIKTDVETLRSSFDEITESKSNMVSISEIANWVDCNECQAIFQKIFASTFRNQSEMMYFYDFCVLTWEVCTLDVTLMAQFTFQIYDINNSKKIEKKELLQMICDLHGPNFEKNTSATVLRSKLNEHDAPYITKDYFINLCETYEPVLNPIKHLQCTIQNKIGGLDMWDLLTQYRNRTFNKKYVPVQAILNNFNDLSDRITSSKDNYESITSTNDFTLRQLSKCKERHSFEMEYEINTKLKICSTGSTDSSTKTSNKLVDRLEMDGTHKTDYNNPANILRGKLSSRSKSQHSDHDSIGHNSNSRKDEQQTQLIHDIHDVDLLNHSDKYSCSSPLGKFMYKQDMICDNGTMAHLLPDNRMSSILSIGETEVNSEHEEF